MHRWRVLRKISRAHRWGPERRAIHVGRRVRAVLSVRLLCRSEWRRASQASRCLPLRQQRLERADRRALPEPSDATATAIEEAAMGEKLQRRRRRRRCGRAGCSAWAARSRRRTSSRSCLTTGRSSGSACSSSRCATSGTRGAHPPGTRASCNLPQGVSFSIRSSTFSSLSAFSSIPRASLLRTPTPTRKS